MVRQVADKLHEHRVPVAESARQQLAQAPLRRHLLRRALAPRQVHAQRQQHVRGARPARAAAVAIHVQQQHVCQLTHTKKPINFLLYQNKKILIQF